MKLRAENIQKSYKGRKVVNGVSIEVNQGEIVGLLGPNGAGKTTSFYMIVGLVSPVEGKVFLDQQDITKMAMYKRAQLGIGYLPQEVSVFRKMSIENNIMAVLEMTKLSKEERHEKLESLLDEFGLQHVRKNLGQSLSGGEKRRTEIARALATDPKFILLDEPFAGVDPIAVEDIQKIVAKLKERNIGVLITDHNVQETLSITDRTYLLFEGAILKSGTAEELAADPQVRKVYLGKNFVLRKINVLEKDNVELSKEKSPELQSEVSYVSNILNIAKKTQNKVMHHNTMKIDSQFVESTGIDELVMRVKELTSYLSDQKLGMNASKKLSNLRFGPVKQYHRSVFGTLGIDMLLVVLVPFVGWAYYIWYQMGIKKCKADLNYLISQLEALQHLMKNPEMEEML